MVIIFEQNFLFYFVSLVEMRRQVDWLVPPPVYHRPKNPVKSFSQKPAYKITAFDATALTIAFIEKSVKCVEIILCKFMQTLWKIRELK